MGGCGLLLAALFLPSYMRFSLMIFSASPRLFLPQGSISLISSSVKRIIKLLNFLQILLSVLLLKIGNSEIFFQQYPQSSATSSNFFSSSNDQASLPMVGLTKLLNLSLTWSQFLTFILAAIMPHLLLPQCQRRTMSMSVCRMVHLPVAKLGWILLLYQQFIYSGRRFSKNWFTFSQFQPYILFFSRSSWSSCILKSLFGSLARLRSIRARQSCIPFLNCVPLHWKLKLMLCGSLGSVATSISVFFSYLA